MSNTSLISSIVTQLCLLSSHQNDLPASQQLSEEKRLSGIHEALEKLRHFESAEHIDITIAAHGLISLHAADIKLQRSENTVVRYLKNLFPNTLQAIEKQNLRSMMAPWTYGNTEFLQLEIDTLFKQEWLLAGHISSLKENGNFITFHALGERVIIVKGNDGVIRGFHNVCRHRGSRLARAEQGTFRKSIVCPFHGWTYNLDGSLKNIPAEDSFKQINKQQYGLVSVDTEIWHGFVFFRFSGNGPTVAQQLAPVEEHIAPYRFDEMIPATKMNRETVSVNWKTIHDIDNEGYHVPIGHPGLHELFGREYYDEKINGLSCSFGHVQEKLSRNWSVARYQNLLPHFDHLADDKQRLWFYVGLFPNLVFEAHPDGAEFYMTLPVSTDKTLYISQSFILPKSNRQCKAAAYLSRRINRQVGFEDASYVGWIQEGLTSSVFSGKHSIKLRKRSE